MLPLVQRTATALSNWLQPAFGQTLELRPDLDQLEALSPERDALWARLEKTTFLTPNEKRALIGYGPLPGADQIKRENLDDKANFSPGQIRDSLGRWAGGSELVSGPGQPGYSINILDEDALGGHTFDRHVNKPEPYLKARVTGSRKNLLGIVTIGERRAGSFTSVEAANKLVNSTVAQNADKVAAFVSGKFPNVLTVQFIYAKFPTPTGYEAYSPDGSNPSIRPTYDVTARLIRSDRSPKGYIVHSAWPSNSD